MVSTTMWKHRRTVGQRLVEIEANEPQPSRVRREASRSSTPYVTDDPRLPEAPTIERATYRSLGGVMLREDGYWVAVGVDDKPLSAHKEKWQAWRMADRVGVQRVSEESGDGV